MGIAFGILTLLHVGIYLFVYLDRISFVLTLFDDVWFITGLIATVATIILTLTSNKRSQRYLKGTWKTIHKATYYIGFLGIIHGELASKQQNKMLYVLLVIYALLFLYRYRNAFGMWVLGISVFLALFITQPQPKPVVKDVVISTGIAHERCGQFGFHYFEADNGFWDCRLEQ